MKHYTTLLLFLVSLTSYCQIWEQPIDTLDYLDWITRKKSPGIKSYTATRFDENDSIFDYEFNEFDTEGRVIKVLIALAPNQHTDTTKYFYLNGVVQYENIKREHFYNNKNRLIEIRNTTNDSVWSTHLHYKDDVLMEIRYSESNWTTFQYDSNGKILRKEEFKDGKLKMYFSYQHPNENTLIYQNCRTSLAADLPCEETEGHYDTDNNLYKIIKRNGFNEIDRIAEFNSEYNNKGQIVKLIATDSSQPTIEQSVIYKRNEKGDVERIDYFENKELVRYDIYNYTYY